MPDESPAKWAPYLGACDVGRARAVSGDATREIWLRSECNPQQVHSNLKSKCISGLGPISRTSPHTLTHPFWDPSPLPPSRLRRAITLPLTPESVTEPNTEGAPTAVSGLTTRVGEVSPTLFSKSLLAWSPFATYRSRSPSAGGGLVGLRMGRVERVSFSFSFAQQRHTP